MEHEDSLPVSQQPANCCPYLETDQFTPRYILILLSQLFLVIFLHFNNYYAFKIELRRDQTNGTQERPERLLVILRIYDNGRDYL